MENNIQYISDYTIYCTEEQTKKAIKLGAKIECFKYDSVFIKTITTFDGFIVIPTAEQMIGWLESKNVYCDIFPIEKYNHLISFAFRIYKYHKRSFESNEVEYKNRKEATLAAIDEALDYLEKGDNNGN